MIFKIYNCDVGLKISGVNYDFEHVNKVEIETTLRNRKTRGANAKDNIGLTYRDGLKDPAKWTIPILAMTKELKAVLDACFKDQTDIDVYCIDRTDGSQKWARNAVLCNYPEQKSIDDSADSMEVSLEFETFDSSEVHKS